jgi:hypothetical protein
MDIADDDTDLEWVTRNLEEDLFTSTIGSEGRSFPSVGSPDMSEPAPSDGLHKFSCVLCHKRKVKCDRLEPCGYCNRHNDRCTYQFVDRVIDQGADKILRQAHMKLHRRQNEGRKKARVITRIYSLDFNELKTSSVMWYLVGNPTRYFLLGQKLRVRLLSGPLARHRSFNPIYRSRNVQVHHMVA